MLLFYQKYQEHFFGLISIIPGCWTNEDENYHNQEKNTKA